MRPDARSRSAVVPEMPTNEISSTSAAPSASCQLQQVHLAFTPNASPSPSTQWQWNLGLGGRTASTISTGSGIQDRMALHFLGIRKLEVGGGKILKPDKTQLPLRKKKSEAEVPVRQINRASRWVAAVLVLVLVLLAARGYWNMVHLLLKRRATWEWISMSFIPIGMVFFAMALKVGLHAVMSPFIGSIRALNINTEFYSAIPTPVPQGAQLPPIVVQIPVYKEDLCGVIIPTLDSVSAAMDAYVNAGGRVRMLICDDGLQLLDDNQFQQRLGFYQKNKVSFVARPATGRRGLFKKASNLNYAMHIADMVKEGMREAPEKCAGEVLAEIWERMDYRFLAGGDITIPDNALILLLDADTRVPVDCMLLTVGEFMADPELPYTQHFTTPFDNQNRNYWEQLISHFTNKIYGTGIAIAASQGEYAPLVGHNAFLRYSSMQGVMFHCPLDNQWKYWSETTVSEDFDLFMRFAVQNQFGRYVMYTGNGFQEGVSLSYIDEVIKLRKFTYGACEMCFKPLIQWWRGPFSPIVSRFVTSRLPWYWKVGLLTYLGTFVAMASAFPFVLLEASMSIYSPDFVKSYSVHGFDVMLTCVFLFGGAGTFHEILIDWRRKALSGISPIRAIWDNLKWLPFVSLTYMSVCFSMTTAAFCYFFGVKIVWGATVKETTDMTCWGAIQAIWAMFKLQYVVIAPLLGFYIIAIIWYDLTMYNYWGPVWYAGMHLVAPFLLSPHIMSLSF